MHAHTQDTDSIAVTEHAKLRFRQRVDAAEPFPGERIRELLEEAAFDTAPDRDAIAWRVKDLVLVTDRKRRVVQTLYRDLGNDDLEEDR